MTRAIAPLLMCEVYGAEIAARVLALASKAVRLTTERSLPVVLTFVETALACANDREAGALAFRTPSVSENLIDPSLKSLRTSSNESVQLASAKLLGVS